MHLKWHFHAANETMKCCQHAYLHCFHLRGEGRKAQERLAEVNSGNNVITFRIVY